MSHPTSNLTLRTLISSDGELRLSLETSDIAAPERDEIVIRVEAAPINPSDLLLMLSHADLSTMRAAGTHDRPVVTAHVPPSHIPLLQSRLDQSMTVGNEGAGTVVAAGPDAREMIGKLVAVAGGSMFATYRVARARDAIVLPPGVSARHGAGAFVNPLTTLAMVETMRHEGHKAIVHTAAASNLGQMLQRLCSKDGIDLVNIVRSAEQANILRDLGAVHLCDSSSDRFADDLVRAIDATGATIAFDAVGGGQLAEDILIAMETSLSRGAPYNRYGSPTHKQVYVYGALDFAPTTLSRRFGFAWGVSGWLFTNRLPMLGAERVIAMRARIASEITTTFASTYAGEISLAEALNPRTITSYNRRATGQKFLIAPYKGEI